MPNIGNADLDEAVRTGQITVAERRQTDGCASVSPAPSQMYWGVQYGFTVCCENPNHRPVGHWHFLSEDGRFLAEGRFGFSSAPDPCASFPVGDHLLRVPVGAWSFLITINCNDPRQVPPEIGCRSYFHCFCRP